MADDEEIKVLLAEDHDLVRAGLSSLLREQEGIKLVAATGNGRQALQMIEEKQPHVAILDVRMPEMSGLEVVEQVSTRCPDVQVIMLSMYEEEEYVLQALRTGAKGYLLKNASPQEFADAVRAVAQGDIYLSQGVSHHLAADYLRRLAPAETTEKEDSLTQRQHEILCLITRGLSTKQIAAELHISPKTVESHRLQLMERLGIHDVAGLVRYGFQKGLVDLDG